METTTTSTPPAELQASGADTLKELVDRGGAGYTVVRHNLTQINNDGERTPGVLGKMVTARKRRALQLYLLLITAWPWLKGQGEAPLAAAVWARALGTKTGRKWSTTNVSEAWGDLEELGLITRRRLARGVVITPRREDARAEYLRPEGVKKDWDETYFSLPPAFWTDEWFERLSMPALAMLLIVAARTSKEEETWLTNKDTADWYGLSARSVEGGLAELKKVGLLHERVEWIKAPLSPIGATERHYYSLLGDFSTDARRKMQTEAKEARATRVGDVTRPKKAKTKKKAKAKNAGMKTDAAKEAATRNSPAKAAKATKANPSVRVVKRRSTEGGSLS